MNTLNSARLLTKFNQQELIESYQQVINIKSLPAGYPGEGNIAWNAITIYSITDDNDSALQQLPLYSSLARLNLKLRLVRFMLLEPGGVIKEHSDTFLAGNIARLHIPIITNDDVEFFLDGKKCSWQPGELWFGDFSKPHHGINKSDVTRIHLVLDVIVSQELFDLFPPEFIHQFHERFPNLNELNSELNTDVLKKFACSFKLPAGFNLPGLPFGDLINDLTGEIKVIGSELSLFVNQQPVLKIDPLTEDKLSVTGLGESVYLDYVFKNNKAKSIALNINDFLIPITLIETEA